LANARLRKRTVHASDITEVRGSNRSAELALIGPLWRNEPNEKGRAMRGPFCLHKALFVQSLIGTGPKIAAVEARAALISCATPSLARGA
jgi:hypothetical protein